MINEIIKKNGVSFGIVTGIFTALMSTTIYSIDLNLFASWWVGIISKLVYFAIVIVLLTKTKKEINGFFSFKDAFTTYFICVTIGIGIGTVFSVLLFNIIDPSAQTMLTEITIKNAVSMMQKMGTPASIINEKIEQLKESNPITELIKSAVFSIVFSSIIGLIMAAFFKSKSQE